MPVNLKCANDTVEADEYGFNCEWEEPEHPSLLGDDLRYSLNLQEVGEDGKKGMYYSASLK